MKIKKRKLVRPRPTASYTVGLSERGKKLTEFDCPHCGAKNGAATDGVIAKCPYCMRAWRVSK